MVAISLIATLNFKKRLYKASKLKKAISVLSKILFYLGTLLSIKICLRLEGIPIF